MSSSLSHISSSSSSHIQSSSKNDHDWKPQALVLGPGGEKGFLELGALKYLDNENFLSDIKVICGCSVGTIIGLLYNVGYKISEIVFYASKVNIFEDLYSIDVKRIINNMKSDLSLKSGLVNVDVLRSQLEKLIRNKFDMIPTLKQLYDKTGIKLIATTVNLTLAKAEYISFDNHPNLSCIDAALMSSNIPYIFKEIKHQGHTYVDGNIGDPYPIGQVDDKNTNVLGLYITSKNNDINNDRDSDIDEGERNFYSLVSANNQTPVGREENNTIDDEHELLDLSQLSGSSFTSFASVRLISDNLRFIKKFVNDGINNFKQMMICSANENINRTIKYSSDKCKHIELILPYDMVTLSFSPEMKGKMLKIGWDAAKNFLAKQRKPRSSTSEMYNYPLYIRQGAERGQGERGQGERGQGQSGNDSNEDDDEVPVIYDNDTNPTPIYVIQTNEAGHIRQKEREREKEREKSLIDPVYFSDLNLGSDNSDNDGGADDDEGGADEPIGDGDEGGADERNEDERNEDENKSEHEKKTREHHHSVISKKEISLETKNRKTRSKKKSKSESEPDVEDIYNMVKLSKKMRGPQIPPPMEKQALQPPSSENQAANPTTTEKKSKHKDPKKIITDNHTVFPVVNRSSSHIIPRNSHEGSTKKIETIKTNFQTVKTLLNPNNRN